MQNPISDPLHHMIKSEGAKVLVHGITLDSAQRMSYRIIRWCSSYWTDGNDGRISGPWTTLASALRHTPAGELHAGASHNIFCPGLQPEEVSRLLVSVGDGAPRAVTINGTEWFAE